jgi:hypothetical protein
MDLERPPIGPPEKGLKGIASGYKTEKEDDISGGVKAADF